LQLKQDNSKMEFKIIKQEENHLFNRKEIQLEVKAQITPSRAEIQKIISEKFSVSIDNIKINKIDGKFGTDTFIIGASIYNSKEEKDKLEIKKKKEIEAEKKVAESQKEDENKESKPKEESKSEEESNKTTE